MSRKRFEYCTIRIELHENKDPDYFDDVFNQFGEEGWEMVTAVPNDYMDDDGDTYTKYFWYTFKRELQ